MKILVTQSDKHCSTPLVPTALPCLSVRVKALTQTPRKFKKAFVVRIMAATIFDWCLQRHSSGSPPDRDPGFLRDAALLLYLVRFALFFEPRRSCRRLPRLGQLVFPPKLLRRFLRGCAVATAHGLVTAPSGVYVDAMEKMIWKNRIVARVISGFVMSEVVQLQAAAAAHIVDGLEICVPWGCPPPGYLSAYIARGVISTFIKAAERGDVAFMLSYLMAHPDCYVNAREDSSL